jgi:hypothetical protein
MSKDALRKKRNMFMASNKIRRQAFMKDPNGIWIELLQRE